MHQSSTLYVGMDVHAGVEVWRGARVRHVQPGTPPQVQVEREGRVQVLQARLVVAGDGCHSLVRQWAGFSIHRDPPLVLIAVGFLEGLSTAPDTGHIARILSGLNFAHLSRNQIPGDEGVSNGHDGFHAAEKHRLSRQVDDGRIAQAFWHDTQD
jgi:2-polyprenyl-6-methoxyphenol hydroxylase-like FAD-dependent oxidoreductase